jgi:cell division protein FtsW (lipid II flippase)
MCPMCWATTLLAFAGMSIVSVVLVAGYDKWIWMLCIVLAAMATLFPWNSDEDQLWSLGATAAAIAARIAYLVVAKRNQLLITRAWQLAQSIVAARCARKRSGQASLLTIK